MGAVGAVILLIIVGFILFIGGAIIIKNIDEKLDYARDNMGKIIMGEEENITIDLNKSEPIKGDSQKVLDQKVNNTEVIYS